MVAVGGAGFCRLGDIAELRLWTRVIGGILFALPPFAEPPIGYQVAAAGAALVVWCYCDGIVGRLSLGLAALEGLLRLRVALGWTMLFLEAFGPRGA